MENNFDSLIGKYPYPRKIRHHASSNLYIPINQLKVVDEFYPPLIPKEIVAESFLNKKAPNVMDIGCGKSKFLFRYAFGKPQDNILGIEVRRLLAEWAQEVTTQEQIPNTWVFWYTAVNGLDFIQESSIDKVFYFFPDPWPKQRQQRRRLFSVEFLADIYKVLKPKGKLYLATDCDYVHDFHLQTLKKSGHYEYNTPIETEWNLPKTNKEEFCIEKNIPIFRLICSPKK